MVRSIWTSFFFAALALSAFFWGTGELQRLRPQKELPFNPLIKGIAAQRDVPVTEHKSFAVVLYAHNAAAWCERALRSVFEQDYDHYRVLFVDDGSIDGTLERAQRFIVENKQDHRVIAIRNDACLGPVGSLYRAADNCLDREILLPLDAQNWLSHDHVLSRLNQVFQNPDTWISFGQSIQYPSYQIVDAPSFNSAMIEKQGFRGMKDLECPAIAFYAALFKAIHLPDLMLGGRFSESQPSYLTPLLELSGGRYRVLPEPLTFANLAQPIRNLPSGHLEQAALEKLGPYRPLAQFPPTAVQQENNVDLVIFSFDRPLQLYGALESIYRYLTNYQTLTVLYRVSDARFNAAYELVKASFPKVRYIKQSDTPRKDFKPLLVHAIFDSPAEYIVFGVDDMIMKDFVDLKFCRQMLEKTGAYGFYLRFGRHIQLSYMFKKPEPVPPSIPLSNGVYAWDLRFGQDDWAFANSMDMTIYRKADLKKCFTELKYKTPNSLEFIWAHHPPANTIGLYFEQSKMVNLPLNIVNPSDCPHMNFMTAEELLVKFNQGFKIDIDPLYQIDNPSPHYEYIPELILR
jgi:glycosyltransferase involved in cell wall biosynthesis